MEEEDGNIEKAKEEKKQQLEDQAKKIEELKAEQQSNQITIAHCELKHKKNVQKIEDYEKFFVEVLKDKLEEGIAVKIIENVPKIWNFTEDRVATPEECCKSVKQELKLREIKSRRYDEKLWYKAVESHLELNNISTLIPSIGDIGFGCKDMSRLVFRAIIEREKVVEDIKKYGSDLNKIKDIDDKAFQSGLFQALDEAWLLGELKPKSLIVAVIHHLCFDKIIDEDSISAWCEEMDQERLSEFMLLEAENIGHL